MITITVDYDPNASPKISVTPSTAHVPIGEHTIQWVLGTAPENTLLVGADNWHAQKPIHDETLALDPNVFGGKDTNGGDEATFSYDVVLYDHGVRVEDPEIVNDPGGGHFFMHHKSS